MQTFKVKKDVEIKCEWQKTNTAFKHVATLFISGQVIDKVKIFYQNRTWERYTYESVLGKLLDKTKILDKEQSRKWLDNMGKIEDKKVSEKFKVIGAIATLGDSFRKSKKQSNDWKARMLKAGLESYGLIMPDDWNSLNEETKKQRLNAVITELST